MASTAQSKTATHGRPAKIKKPDFADHMPAGYWEIDLDGHITYINQTAAAFLGASPEDLVNGKSVFHAGTDNAEKVMLACREVLATGRPARGICLDMISAIGKETHIELIISLITDQNDRPAGYSGVSIDRTEQKEAEKALIKSKERYRIILESIEEGYYEVALDGALTFFNSAMARLNGYPPEKMMGMKSTGYAATPEDERHLHKEFKKVYDTGEPAVGIQYAVRGENGNVKHLQTSASLLKNESGKIIGFKGIARDISEIHQVQLALQESEERHRSIISTSPDTIAFFDMNFKMLMINPAGLKLLGYDTSEGITGKTILKHIPRDNQPSVTRDFLEGFETNRAYSKELYLLKKDGSTFPAEVRAAVIADKKGGTNGFIVIVRDITRRLQAEEVLKDAHKRISMLINSISSILIVVSRNGKVDFWNTEAAKQFGISRETALGKKLTDLNIEWDLSTIATGIRQCLDQKEFVRFDDVKFRQTNGKEGLLDIRMDRTFLDADSETAVLLQGANITQRKVLENQLSQAQKLEAIGSLAAGIAHEINTPTQYVGDNTRFLETAFGDLSSVLGNFKELLAATKAGTVSADQIAALEIKMEETDLDYLMEDIPGAIRQSLEGIDRITTIVQSIKEFSHPDQEEKTYVDINKSLESTITVARNEWKYVAEIKTDFNTRLPMVLCHPGELNQVFLNMIINAAHAIEEVTRKTGTGKGTIFISTGMDEAGIIVSIKDTGNGMSQDIQQKIFDPFFTTKEVGKGTGQGLAISHTVVVEKHGGAIQVHSAPGEGTEFLIFLPLSDSPASDEKRYSP